MKIAKKSAIVLLFTYFEKKWSFYLNQLLDLTKLMKLKSATQHIHPYHTTLFLLFSKHSLEIICSI